MDSILRPPPGTHHAWQKFYLAVTEFVEGQGDVRSRLKAAYENHLWGLHPQELPKDLRADFAWIMHMLTRRQPRWEGDTELKASLSRMRNSTGSEIAKKIFRVYRSLDEIRSQYSGEGNVCDPTP